MPDCVFRFYQLKEIRELLIEIGQYEYKANLDNMKLSPPLTMEGFYLENNRHCTFLVYQYPLVACKIMKVDRYKIPLKGWELKYLDN